MEKPNQHVSLGVTEVASDALRIPEDALPPLAKAVDPDALEALVSPPEGLHRSDVRVTFEYAGLDVVVQTGPTVYASPIGEPWEVPA